MLRFKRFLSEQVINDLIEISDLLEATNISGAIGTERRGLSHLKNYLIPFLSAEQKKHVATNFKNHQDPEKLDDGQDGTHYNPDPEATTHTLASSVNGYPENTPVKITGVRHDQDGKIFVQTANHGEMQASKLNKPGQLKKKRMTEAGFEVERKIADNLGTEAAGSTGSAYDFSYRGNEEHGVRGKVRKLEGDKPDIAGESKLNKAKMGNSAVAWNPDTRTWGFSHEGLRDKFAEARHSGSGLPLLEHLNTYHSDGKIAKGFTVKAPTGTTRTYLNGLGVNTLHLHRKKNATRTGPAYDNGTTYTIGNNNQLQGKTKLGHLDDDALDRLDGNLTIEKTTTGSARVAHVPNFKTFEEYALNSVHNQDNHRDLTNDSHAKEFRSHIDKHLASQSNQTQIKPKQISPEELSQAKPKKSSNVYYNNK